MSEYQVIARKWRPQRFGDVVGQQHVVRTLENAIRQQRTAHAYLFVGPRGVGKTTLARIFAKAMNCLDPQDGEPCCRCESCRAIAEERSLDVMEVDAASRNTTGDMRELAEDVLTQPVGGRYKIYIIDEVHMLSKQAWNVLLKTVEEPPAHVKFIFATTEVHQVLPTIISRCQRFDLLPIPTRLITERLRLICDSEQVKINDSAIGAIARAAEGGMRDAQSLLDQMIAFFSQGDDTPITGEQVLSLFGLTDRTDLDALMVAMLRNAPGEVVSIVSRLARKGKNLETLFDDLLEAMRAVQLCAILPDPSDLIDEGEEAVARYRKLAALAKPDTIQILLEIIAPVGRVLHDALNKQVYLETILLKSMREAHAVRIDDLLARLNQLRTAGELKFIDQLPPVVKRTEAAEIEPLKPQPEAPAPAPAPAARATPPPAPQEPAPGTGHNGSCAASGSTGPHAAACCRGKRPCSGSSRACAGTAGCSHAGHSGAGSGSAAAGTGAGGTGTRIRTGRAHPASFRAFPGASGGRTGSPCPAGRGTAARPGTDGRTGSRTRTCSPESNAGGACRAGDGGIRSGRPRPQEAPQHRQRQSEGAGGGGQRSLHP